MANTFSQIYFHIVFSTKNRVDFIRPDIEARVWAYIGGIARNHKMTALQVGGIDNHIHALVGSPTTLMPSQVAKYLKGDSSYWIHNEFPDLADFGWQDGYGVFSVSRSIIPSVIDYIKHQREHHKNRRSKKNLSNCWNSTASNTTNNFFLDDSPVADATRMFFCLPFRGLQTHGYSHKVATRPKTNPFIALVIFHRIAMSDCSRGL